MTSLGRVSNTRLPTDWTVVALGDLLAKLMDFRGRTPKKLGMDWGGGAIPALSANNVRMGFVDFKRECYLGSEELYKAWMVQGDVKRHDLVFTMEAPLGNVAVISDDRKYILSQRVVLLRPNSKVQFEYLFQYLRGDAFTALLDSNSTGTTAKGIQQKRLVQLPVVVPPIAEQQKIAVVLTAVDDKLKVIARQIEVTQALKQGLMQTLLSRGVGTQDATGRWIPHTEFKDSELGAIPARWSVKEIGEALSVVERPIKMADDQLYRRVTVRRRHGGVDLRDELPGAGIKVKNQFLLEAGDFLISERQIVHGACGILPEHLAGALVSNEYLVLQAKEGFDVTYFNYLVQLLKYSKLFLVCSQGVDIEKFLFKPKDWLKKRIPVPPLAEQQRIAEILATIEEKTNALQRKQSEYENLKRGLMQKLLTGEWRVKLDSPTGIA